MKSITCMQILWVFFRHKVAKCTQSIPNFAETEKKKERKERKKKKERKKRKKEKERKKSVNKVTLILHYNRIYFFSNLIEGLK